MWNPFVVIWRRLSPRKSNAIPFSTKEMVLFGAACIPIVALAYVALRSLDGALTRDLAVPLLLNLSLAELLIGALIVQVTRRDTFGRAIRVGEERYRLLADNVTDIILQQDLESRIDYVSPSVRQFGYSPEAVIGRTILDFAHPDDVEAVERRLAEVRLGRTGERFEARARKADGGWIWVESNASAIRDDRGQIVGILSVLRDVTARKQADEAMREVRAEMARVARISALGALSATIAHEINQPLAALVTNSELARRLLSIDPPDFAQIERAVERSAQDARRASEIITGIQSLAARRATASADFDMRDAIDEVLVLLRAELQRLKVSVETALPRKAVLVQADRVQILQVLLNLIQNAVEAMRHASPALLRLRCSAEADGYALVEVEDRGPGLDPASADAAFEYLFTTKDGGTGMGLAISRSIIEAHGGRIWVGPAEPRGAVFKFRLPQRGTHDH